MNFDKESKSSFFSVVVVVVGGGGGGGYEHKSRHILSTRHIVTTSTEPYSLMKIFLTVFQMEGIVALTIKGR